MNLKFVVYVKTETGRISRISIPHHNIDKAGISEDTTMRIIHIFEDNIPEGCHDTRYFMDYHWYNSETESFDFIGLPPNRHSVWSSTDGWSWDAESLLQDIVLERNRFLFSSDWTQSLDAPLTEAKLQEWRDYRQALRDLPSTIGNVSSVSEVIWPTAPK